MAVCPNESGALIINSIPLETEAWTVLNSYHPLWTYNKYVESPPEHISGNPGSIVFAPEVDGATFDLQFVVIGECDSTGELFDDPWVGLESNINMLRANILDPIPTNKGLQPATLVMPSGAERVADILVRPPIPGAVSVGNNGSCSESGSVAYSVFARYVIPIMIPSGIFAAA